MPLFQGTAVALATPFRDGAPDFAALERLIEFQLENHIDALVSCGTTGEASTLSMEEQIQIVQFTVAKAAGRVPVIAGAGKNNTASALAAARAMEYAGADGLLMVTPYYNKCSEQGLIRHYITIADQLSCPVILYSVPSRTGVNISPSAVSVLSRHPNICGIKEASGNISQIVEISKYCSENFALYSGNDDSVVPLLSMGGSGVISTAANVIPQAMHDMTQAWFFGKPQEACRLQREYKALIDALFCEVNPIPVKYALHLMGFMEEEYRLPLCPPSDAAKERIQKTLADYGLVSQNV